jgi:hypothetical protein
MACEEKARQKKGEPIPNVCQDDLEIKPQPLDLQVSRIRRCSLSADAAATLAPLIFGEAAR